MVELRFTPATQADADQLAAELRAADRREIIAANGPDINRTLRLAVEVSFSAFAVRRTNGDLVALFGCATSSLLGEVASPWLLSTPLIERHARMLGITGKRYFAEMNRLYPLLVNYIDARNKVALRLVSWIGCTLGEPEPWGVAGRPFRRFEMRRL